MISWSHGHGRFKAAAFAAVPDILKRGRIIHSEALRGSTNGKVHHVAAPIRMNGKDYVADVLVKSDAKMKRMYVHEVALREKLQQSVFKTGAIAAEAGKLTGTDVGTIRKVLQSVFAVNPETVSKVVDENGEPSFLINAALRIHGRTDTGSSRHQLSPLCLMSSPKVGSSTVRKTGKAGTTIPSLSPHLFALETPTGLWPWWSRNGTRTVSTCMKHT